MSPSPSQRLIAALSLEGKPTNTAIILEEVMDNYSLFLMDRPIILIIFPSRDFLIGLRIHAAGPEFLYSVNLNCLRGR